MEHEGEEGSLRGRLLVATPSLGDLNFDRTVVLVLEHTAEGAVGVVLNRPSEVDVSVPLPDWAEAVSAPPRVFVGGPVAQGAVLGLARCDPGAAGESWAPVVDDLGTVDLSVPPQELHLPLDRLRIFTGYSGWGSGQLENEIAGGAWLVVERDPQDPFTLEPASLWADVMKRQGDEKLRAGAPRHPWLN